MSGWWGHYDFRCQLVDYSRSPMAMRVSRLFRTIFACPAAQGCLDHQTTSRARRHNAFPHVVCALFTNSI